MHTLYSLIIEWIKQIKKDKVASMIFVSPSVFRNIKNLKSNLKKKKSDIDSIRTKYGTIYKCKTFK